MSQTPSYYLENPLKTPQRFKNITHSEKTQFNVSIVDEVLQTFLILPSRWMSQRMIKVYFNIGVCGAWLTSDIKGTSDFGLWPWIQFSVTEAAPRCDSSTRSLINLHSFWKVKDDQISGKTISGSVKMQILLVPQSSEMARYFSMRLQDCSSHTGGSRWLGPFFLNSLFCQDFCIVKKSLIEISYLQTQSDQTITYPEILAVWSYIKMCICLCSATCGWANSKGGNKRLSKDQNKQLCMWC